MDEVDPESVTQLLNMGFPEETVKNALTKFNNVVQAAEAKPSVLGIGVPGIIISATNFNKTLRIIKGGFNVEERSLYKDVYSLYLYNSAEEILIENNSNLPSFVERSVNSIIRSESGFSREKVAEWQETLKESTYAKSLVQLDNGVKIPPTGHQCQKCTLKRNLWLNLTDGSILCGRKQPGIVGNSHALLHYQLTKYPLCVKLGTISSQGADVYSYPEDEMVKDPFLEKHLSHFGIDMHILQKTEKTMAEYDIDVNWKHEWDLITEKDYELEKCYGPGFTGIINLGNTCYMASVLQLIFSLKGIWLSLYNFTYRVVAFYNCALHWLYPEFIAKYYDGYYECVKENILADP
ncbi:hypothetical protein Zmor_022080, partial [Zophobas morio]